MPEVIWYGLIRRCTKFIAVLALVTAGIYLFRLQILPWAADVLDVGSAPQRVDFVMALPGDPERRPFVAAAMMNVGLADTALIPKNIDTPAEIDGLVPPTYEVSRRVYEARGIAAERIIILDGATQSTYDDLVLLARHRDHHPGATAGVVTSAFHTRRTQWTLHARFPEHAGRVLVISAPNPSFDAEAWWRSDVGFVLIIFEHLKAIIYWVQYGTGVFWIVAFVLVTSGVGVRRYYVHSQSVSRRCAPLR
ncbi:MAG: YdcF family protein [Planctomycetia bacterium]|nr:YdcF family protein [Planctomycetia bacterium]